MFKITVNDTTEIYFGVMTVQLQSYGKVGLTNDGGVSQARVNYDLLHLIPAAKKIPNRWRGYYITSQRR